MFIIYLNVLTLLVFVRFVPFSKDALEWKVSRELGRCLNKLWSDSFDGVKSTSQAEVHACRIDAFLVTELVPYLLDEFLKSLFDELITRL